MAKPRLPSIADTQQQWNRRASEIVARVQNSVEVLETAAAALPYLTLTVADASNAAIPDADAGVVSLCQQNNLNDAAIYVVGGGGAALLGTSSGNWEASTTTPGAGKASVAWSGTAYTVYNNTGMSLDIAYHLLALSTGT